MKPIKRAVLAAALSAALSASGAAAGPEPVGAAASRPRTDGQPVRMAQVVYQVLLGEIALQRGRHELSVGAYGDLAVRTRDPAVLARTVEVASIARYFDVAHDAARIWVEVEPASDQARQTLAAVLILQGKLDELGPQLSRLLEQDRENLAGNLMRLNRMLARIQDRVAVRRMLERVLAPYADVPEAHYALATAAFHAGDQAGALAEIRRAAALRSDWAEAVLFEAQLLARDALPEALALLERFVEAHPDAANVRLQLARALLGERRHVEARRHFDRLLADSPDDPELLHPAAVLALQQDDVAVAEPLLKRLLERGRTAERNLAAYYLARIADDRGDNAGALSLYLRVEPGEHYPAAQIRAAALRFADSGDPAEAIARLKQAALDHPAGADQFLVAEARLLRDAGKSGEAMALFERIVASQPEQADVLYDMALLAEKLGRMEVVESNLRRVIALRPDNAHAYNALGYSFADRGIRLDEARALIEQALALAPGDPFIIDSLGWALYRQGDLKGAEAQLRKALSLRADAEIAAHLGEVLWKLDRREEARKIWDEAGRRFPDNEVLRAVRQRFAP